ncbi:MAG TPA: hypothetical protein VK272_07870 [Solirubrobacteraceae bacterium]|nr:hypothetical protein [Solirubrobacteraceae bacterium]
MSPRLPRWMSVRALGLATGMSVLLCALLGTAPALANEALVASHWYLEVRSAPTSLPPGGFGRVTVTAANLGDEKISGKAEHVTITDKLPAGLTATGAVIQSKGTGNSGGHLFEGLSCSKKTGEEVVCGFDGKLPPYEQLEVLIAVEVEKGLGPQKLTNKATVTGGGASEAVSEAALTVSSEKTQFGVESYVLVPENENFEPDFQAGAHPFQLTATFNLNDRFEADFGEPETPATDQPTAPALQRNLNFKLPPGMIGNANVIEGDANFVQRCSDIDFGTEEQEEINACPNDTVMGVATVTANIPTALKYNTYVVPIFNLVPAEGEPAKFGFEIEHVPVILDTSVRTGDDYGVTVSVRNNSQSAQILGSRVTFWGVPEDARHDASRGWSCFGDGNAVQQAANPCEPTRKVANPAPFLMLPTSCQQATTATVEGESWPVNGASIPLKNEYTIPQFHGCGALNFDPSMTVEPETHSASTPTGLKVGVSVPQDGTLSAEGLAEADVQATTVELPEGMLASPGAANGLETCSAGALGLQKGLAEELQVENDHFSEAPASCPDASKIGTVNITTPLLRNPVIGGVYMAFQNTNPFKSPLALYIIAEERESAKQILPQVLVKLAGQIKINPTNGQLVSVFENTPQTPFEHFELHLFSSERASQSTPPFCKTYTTHTTFTSWAKEGGEPAPTANGEPTFAITSGPGGGPCPSEPLPLSPGLEVGSTNLQAGAFTPFTTTITHPDGQQAIERITLHLPPGLAAEISQVTPCPVGLTGAQCAAQYPSSLVGHTTSVSGLGGDPVTLPGQLYFTTGYGGAPFGLLAVTEAKAGPFNLGFVEVKSQILIDPNTAAATVVSEPIPKLVGGVPAQLKTLNVTVERPGNQPFQFNPTSCERMSTTGTITGYEGASAPVSSPFQVANCASLPFHPKLTASVSGQGSKADGVTFAVTTETAGLGQANIHKVDLTIPEVLPSRLDTIQKACLEKAFNANPASCDEGSVIGEGIAYTPVFKNPLRGPAYLVSHGNAAFPDVEFVLQGEGVTIVLDGKTDIKHGITYSRFETAPDAPVTKFVTLFPAGPHSALTAFVPENEKFSLCKHASQLVIPTTIVGQNGQAIQQNTQVALQGCAAVKNFKAKKLTRAQLLAKALKACRTKYKKNKHKRAVCEKQAHKKYSTKKAKKAAHKSAKKSSAGAAQTRRQKIK